MLELVIGGGLLLLLLGGSKKKKKVDGSGANGDSGTNDGIDDGSKLDDPTKKKTQGGGGSGGGSRGSGGAPGNLSKDSVWVSADCKEVVYGDGTGEFFWKNKGLPVAQKFISANYHDPYEIAKMMIISMAPCVVEFPVMEDGYDPMEEEFMREMFNRDFKDVYYLVQFLHDKVSELMGRDGEVIEFDDRCDINFVGESWERPVAERMIRFYIEYMYPLSSEPGHEEKYKSWPLADVDEDNMTWWDNVVTAVINRMHPECGSKIVEAFKKDSHSANSFFATRPGLKASYASLVNLVNWVDDNRAGGLDFKKLDKMKS